MKLRNRIVVLLLALSALGALSYEAAPAAAATTNPVIADCLAHPGGLTGHYTVAQLRQALQVMSPETREYTSCPDVLNRALLAALSTGTSTGTSGGGGGSGSFLPTPVIVVLVVLVLAAVTFGAIAIRRRRDAVASDAADPDGALPTDDGPEASPSGDGEEPGPAGERPAAGAGDLND